MNKFARVIRGRLARRATAGALMASAAAAHAAVPAEVTTALTNMAADAASVGSAVLVAIVGIYAFKLIRRAL